MPDLIFVAGYPGELGGASTELDHTLRLWRRHGLEVALVPNDTPDPRWRARMDRLGCVTLRATPETVHLPAGSTVVAFCNERFLHAAHRFREAGCRIVWAGCMNWLFPAERLHYRRHGPFDRYVFQSRYQRDALVPQLRKVGFRDEQGHLIRGALDLAAFPYRPRPRAKGDVFTLGRISRAAADKFGRESWSIYGGIPREVRVRVLGWHPRLEAELGPPPPWAECLPERAVPAREFLGSLHCLAPWGGEAVENWPRAGLEAMAAGVPVVAEARGGWTEMIQHGHTGYLARTAEEFARSAARLADDEPHRLAIAAAAREAVEHDLAPADTIWRQWRRLFEELEG